MIAHLLHNGGKACHAFIGGICKNYNSNWLHGDEDIAVVEADEFDASFLNLKPNIAVITAIDSDHLDIYGDHNKIHEAFEAFASQINDNGCLFLKDGLNIKTVGEHISYSYNKGDCFAQNIVFELDQSYIPCFHFDLIFKDETIEGVSLYMPGNHNIENAVVASAIAHEMGLDSNAIKKGLSSFKGIKRRFEYHSYIDPVFIDDYAHHPEEIKVTLEALKTLYPNKKLTGIFQPHLYSRTKDFYEDFAKCLSTLDELILLDIYPAREESLEGVTSELIYNKVEIKNKKICSLEQLPGLVKSMKNNIEVLITMGAGDIEKQLPELKKIFI
jgi:UDP-N-acetylmuramate--alanine ligase